MLGILGGMGPMATVDFMRKVVENTPAGRDQDHLDIVVRSAARIPDRTAAILASGADPLPAMLVALRELTVAGANVIAIPCNTAHNWHAHLQASTEARILHIVDEVVAMLPSCDQQHARIGLLATDGTLAAGIYRERLAQLGLECLVPTNAAQATVMEAIRSIKAGQTERARASLLRTACDLRSAGCAAVVMACTEIPVALTGLENGRPSWLLDATDALARAAVRTCLADRPLADRLWNQLPMVA